MPTVSESETMAFAICGAYLMVTFADGHHDVVEEDRFLAPLANDPALQKISAGDLTKAYNTLTLKYAENYAEAATSTISTIKAARETIDAADAIKKAAQCAIVADRRLERQEELVMNQIADALGLEHGDI